MGKKPVIEPQGAWMVAVHKRTPPGINPRVFIKSAITYFPAWQYHRRQGLNCCVRNGNRCGPLPLVTDNSDAGLSPDGGNCHVANVTNRTQGRRGVISKGLIETMYPRELPSAKGAR